MNDIPNFDIKPGYMLSEDDENKMLKHMKATQSGKHICFNCVYWIPGDMPMVWSSSSKECIEEQLKQEEAPVRWVGHCRRYPPQNMFLVPYFPSACSDPKSPSSVFGPQSKEFFKNPMTDWNYWCGECAIVKSSRESASDAPYEIQTCQFVSASDLFKNYRDVLELISELNWFTWGDANRTLISVSDVYDRLDDFASYESTRNPDLANRVRDFLNEVLLDLCSIDGLYIDFEN